MKREYTQEQKYIRSLIAKNILEKRKLAKDIKIYCLHGLGKRKINSISKNIDYLIILTKKFNELDQEGLFLFRAFINTEINK